MRTWSTPENFSGEHGQGVLGRWTKASTGISNTHRFIKADLPFPALPCRPTLHLSAPPCRLTLSRSPLPPRLQASEGGSDLAKKLVELYFTMFRMVIEGHFGRAGEARK